MKIQFAFAVPLLAAVSCAAVASSADTTFAMKAAQGNLAEIADGRIALANGTSDGVRQFGQRLIDDHGKSNDALNAAAKKSGVDLPASPSQQQQDESDNLKAMTGKQFDRHFATMMVKDHEEDIAMFRKEARSGDDADLRAYAKAALPTLQAHLRIAKQLAH